MYNESAEEIQKAAPPQVAFFVLSNENDCSVNIAEFGGYEMKKMTVLECRTFLLERVRTAKLATVKEDGHPHVVPIWFELDGEQLVFTTWHTSIKAKNIKRDPRVSICVDSETPPFAFVKIDGTVTMSDNLDELRYWATRIAGRYMGEELAETYGERNSIGGELLVRVTPTKIIGQNDVAGW
jgi:PPOX class probable F420-dependent enzyme